MLFQSEKPKMIPYGIYAGLLEGVYIALVGLFMINANKLFGSNQGDTPASFIIFLLLFVFSAGLSGLIVFSYPVFLVTQRKFREAVLTVLVTLVTLLFLFILSYLLFVVVVS